MEKMSDVFDLGVGGIGCNSWWSYEQVAAAITAISAYDNHIELLRQCIPHLQFNDPELLAKVKEAVK